MKRWFAVLLSALAACSDGPAPLPAEDGGAPSLDGGPAAVDGGSVRVPVGAACTRNGECGDVATRECLDEEGWGFPGGYCSRGCSVGGSAQCGTGARCLLFPEGGACVKTCAEDAECRAGYVCADNLALEPVGGPKVCMPGVRSARVGDPCTKTSECGGAPSALCLTESGGLFPAGYCTEECRPAAASNSCGSGALCVPNTNTTLGGVCLRLCSPGSDAGLTCRAGYTCGTTLFGASAGGSVCVPGVPVAPFGAPCSTHGDCEAGGFCAPARDGLRGGYCTRDCDTTNPTSCGDTGQCLIISNGRRVCAKKCAANGDCRDGYACAPRFLNSPSPVTVCSPGTTNAVAIGAPCADHGSCNVERQFCLGPSGDFPGGYCTVACNPQVAGVCGQGATCFPTSEDDPSRGICFASCGADGDCAARRTGGTGTYGCSDRVVGGNPVPGGGRICVAYKATSKVGDPCTGFGDCPLGRGCIVDEPRGEPRWRGGYCADLCDATMAMSCGDGTACVALNARNPTDGVCMASCTTSDTCRQAELYSCRLITSGRANVCAPPVE